MRERTPMTSGPVYVARTWANPWGQERPDGHDSALGEGGGTGDSHAKIRADVVHDRLLAMGFGGNDRTTRRGVAAAKKAYRAGRRRSYRPWLPEPGKWLQFDWDWLGPP